MEHKQPSQQLCRQQLVSQWMLGGSAGVGFWNAGHPYPLNSEMSWRQYKSGMRFSGYRVFVYGKIFISLYLNVLFVFCPFFFLTVHLRPRVPLWMSRSAMLLQMPLWRGRLDTLRQRFDKTRPSETAEAEAQRKAEVEKTRLSATWPKIGAESLLQLNTWHGPSDW